MRFNPISASTGSMSAQNDIEKIVSMGVESLIDNMASTLDYWQSEGTDLFKRWIAQENRESIEETIETLSPREYPEDHLSPDIIAIQLPKLTQMLRSIQSRYHRGTRLLRR